MEDQSSVESVGKGRKTSENIQSGLLKQVECFHAVHYYGQCAGGRTGRGEVEGGGQSGVKLFCFCIVIKTSV